MSITEGLRSAMLSIWLRDVLRSCSVQQHMIRGITQPTSKNVLSLPE